MYTDYYQHNRLILKDIINSKILDKKTKCFLVLLLKGGKNIFKFTQTDPSYIFRKLKIKEQEFNGDTAKRLK